MIELSLINLIIVLVLIGAGLYLLGLAPFDPTIIQIIRVVLIVVAVILVLLFFAGVLRGGGVAL